MTCTLPEHITEQLAASEECFNSLEFFCFECRVRQKQKFESWKAWWEYLKSTAANVASKGHQKYEEMGSTVNYLWPQSSPFPRGSTSPNTNVLQVGPDKAGTSQPVWHKQITCCLMVSMYLHLGLLPIWPHWTEVQSIICPQSLPSPPEDLLYHGCNGAAL